MINQAPKTRKHFYDLTSSEDKDRAVERIECFDQLAVDAENVWWENGYWHILVNQLCLQLRFRVTETVLLIEWKTRRRSELEDSS